ncbi:MAG: hypothetical protein AAF847_03950 [Bacteroidota bacterium]
MLYKYKSFSKADRKILVSLVEVSIKREIDTFLHRTLNYYQSMLKKEHEDIRKPYWKLEGKFSTFSKHLTEEYDGWTHTYLPSKIVLWWLDGHLKEEDIETFSLEGQDKLRQMRKSIEELRAEE